MDEKWLKRVIEIQSLAQCGLAYCKDDYDLERYRRLREIAAEMMSDASGLPVEKVQDLFCNESGYQTPKLDTRAAVFREGKILLVRENNGRWSLPGGWVDVLESIASNTVKEVQEEAGVTVRPQLLIAVQDRNQHNRPPYAYGVCKVFVLCDYIEGRFKQNIETTATAYFDLDHLPPLAEEKCNRAQVEMCFAAAADPNWSVLFD